MAEPNSTPEVDVVELAQIHIALTPAQLLAFNERLSELRCEKAAAESERLARLRAMPDQDLLQEILWECTGMDSKTFPAHAVLMLTEAGFVRHGLEAAYRAGFAASGEGWNGEHPGNATDDLAFADRMESDLEALRSA